jgi:protocatechuate 3,4-dioxygenase beta subunit
MSMDELENTKLPISGQQGDTVSQGSSSSDRQHKPVIHPSVQENTSISHEKVSDGKRFQTSRRTVTAVIISALGILGIGSAGLAWMKRETSSSVAEATQQSATGASNSSCTVLATELTEGPYYLDVKKIRSNITEGKAGIPLVLRVTVTNAITCQPIENAAADIWHCDALGLYSGFIAASEQAGGLPPGGPIPNGTPPPAPGGPPNGTPPPAPGGPVPNGTPSLAPGGPPNGGLHHQPTDNQTFLRGIQLTNHSGIVEFRTIYPGWYNGRATHIHIKIHLDGTASGSMYNGGHLSHTGQFFFLDDICEQVGKLKPYVTNTVVRTLLTQDSIYPAKNKAGALLTLTRLDEASLEAGFLGTATVVINPNAIPAAV